MTRIKPVRNTFFQNKELRDRPLAYLIFRAYSSCRNKIPSQPSTAQRDFEEQEFWRFSHALD